MIQLEGATWQDYLRLLEVRGDRSAPRISYLEGRLEIMSPSRDHEVIKSLIGCLVETYCLHAGVRFSPYGSWTLKDERNQRGAEPDECYIFGDQDADRPHLAIEVLWTSGRLDKLDVYRKLGVGEVWYWEKGRIRVYVLVDEEYEERPRSQALPEIDLDLLVAHLDRPTAYDAIHDFRAALSRQG